jgi:hypothetical protein
LPRLRGVVQIGGDWVATGPTGRGRSAATTTAASHAQSCLAIPFFDYVLNVSTAHADPFLFAKLDDVLRPHCLISSAAFDVQELEKFNTDFHDNNDDRKASMLQSRSAMSSGVPSSADMGMGEIRKPESLTH